MNESTPETNKKLEFLQKLLEKNPDIKKQFDEFILDQRKPLDDDSSKYIENTAVELSKK